MPMKTCTIEGCEGTHRMRRGLCGKHYTRWYRYGDPLKTIRVRHVKDPTQDPTNEDMAWTAGFVEGEGYFEKAKNCSVGFGQKVAVDQVQKEPLEKLQALFGGSLTVRNRTTGDIWVWSLSGPPARQFLTTILPRMSTRRKQQITKVLES